MLPKWLKLMLLWIEMNSILTAVIAMEDTNVTIYNAVPATNNSLADDVPSNETSVDIMYVYPEPPKKEDIFIIYPDPGKYDSTAEEIIEDKVTSIPVTVSVDNTSDSDNTSDFDNTSDSDDTTDIIHHEKDDKTSDVKEETSESKVINVKVPNKPNNSSSTADLLLKLANKRYKNTANSTRFKPNSPLASLKRPSITNLNLNNINLSKNNILSGSLNNSGSEEGKNLSETLETARLEGDASEISDVIVKPYPERKTNDKFVDNLQVLKFTLNDAVQSTEKKGITEKNEFKNYLRFSKPRPKLRGFAQEEYGMELPLSMWSGFMKPGEPKIRLSKREEKFANADDSTPPNAYDDEKSPILIVGPIPKYLPLSFKKNQEFYKAQLELPKQ